MSSKFMRGSSLLLGDNTVPGVQLPEELKKIMPDIFKAVRDFGCDFYPTVVQMLTYDEISEVASYGGFPVRFPHWKWGMEYESLQRGYEHGMHRIYEMVINTNPCYIYCLNSNTLVDNVTVIAHALGHNDFFKNNVFFSPTNENMMNKLASHGTRIRRYMQRWGSEKVTEFIDHCCSIETLIDPAKAWEDKVIRDRIVEDERTYRQPKRLSVGSDHDYMEPHINPKGWIDNQKQKIHREEIADQIGIFKNPTKDVMGFLRNNAPLKPWQSDILSMLYEESIYFSPQRSTKMLNEGWASFTDYTVMCEMGLCGLGQEGDDYGIVEYSKHKMGVLGGKYSMNPYKLGFCLFLDIEERWNKGRFGEEYDNCENLVEKENWDKKLGLGREKIFQVRSQHNDLTALMEYFTEDFCNKNEFFEWKLYPNGEYKIENRDHKSIKSKLVQKHLNGGLPEIFLVDPNHKGKGHMLLEHKSDGRPLYEPDLLPTLKSLRFLWGSDVVLSTKDALGEEFVYYCMGTKQGDVGLMTRKEYERDF